MLNRCRYVLYVYLSFLSAFLLTKPFFILYNHENHPITARDLVDVFLHGLPLDLSTSGYLTAVPLVVMLISCFWEHPLLKRFLWIYYGIIAILLCAILLADCLLYSFWQFKIDATVFTYLDSPVQAFASVSIWYIAKALIVLLIMAASLFTLLKSIPLPSFENKKVAWYPLILLTFSGGLIFLAIRGGTGKSTMNIGTAYYSENQFLNHAAVNPAFSLLASTLKAENYEKLYRFYSEKERASIFDKLNYSTASINDSIILNTRRPNIVLVILEGFGATFIEPLGGKPNITPNFNRLSKEGVLFTQCYANSFRTDRGTICTLSGYPSFPSISIMKLPQKSRTLPSIAASLSQEGYQTDFLYGGDINFTNMKSYLLSTGYQTVRGDTHFPISVQKTHAWGVTDIIAFDTLYNQITSVKDSTRRFTTFLTLASHEPWEVPYHRIKNDEKANAMAYTDHCIGRFVTQLKKTTAWQDLLLIFIADHGITYPKGLTEADKRRYHIPMLWIGGAVSKPLHFNKICNQSDLPATLLGQLGIKHDQFNFSRDVLSSTYTYPVAIHTFDEGVSFIDTTGYSVIDFKSGKTLTDKPTPSESRKNKGKAFLQTAIDDLSKR